MKQAVVMIDNNLCLSWVTTEFSVVRWAELTESVRQSHDNVCIRVSGSVSKLWMALT